MLTPDQIITLAVLVLALAALVREWLPVGLVALAAPLALVLLRVIKADVLWGSLSHPAVVAVASLFVVSAGISRTDAVGFLGEALTKVAYTGERRTIVILMIAVAAMSAFINNTTVVVVCLPVIVTVCERLKSPPSRYLIPLSFASIFGGMMTLVGTSTNVVVAEMSRVKSAKDHTLDIEIGMWDFTLMGLIFTVVGIVYMTFVGRRLLKDRTALSMSLSGMPTEYVTEAEVLEGSSLVGTTIEELGTRFGLRVLQLIRDDVIETPSPDRPLQEGDALILRGAPRHIVEFTSGSGAALMTGTDPGGTDLKTRAIDMTLAEVVVPPRSRWIDRKVKEIGFRARYGVSVIALQRHGHHIRQKVGELTVEPADMLLVQGTVEALRNLRASEHLILIEGVQDRVRNRGKAPIAMGLLAMFVALVSLLGFDLATAGVLTALLMVLTRCITLQNAYTSFDWNILFMLGGFLALGQALAEVKLDELAAIGMISLVSDAPFWVMIGALYVFTSFLSDVLSNQAVAALMVPIVIRVSQLMAMAPEPLLMAVAFAASGAFLTPMGYQTNLLVYSPGGYRFSDFIRVGLPLRLVFIVLAALFIPLIYA